LTTPGRETPDIETSSEDYARRFSGRAGAYFLECQRAAVAELVSMSPGSRVLDVGGGHGQLAPFLAAAGHDVTVLSSSNACFSRFPQPDHGHCIERTTGDLLNLPFADRSYDLVVSVRLISHIQSWERLVEEFCRIANTAVIIDYPSTSGLNALTPLLFSFKKRIEKNTRTYTSFSKRQLAQTFDGHDFQVTQTRAQFFLPMGLHRALGGAGYMQSLESMFAKIRVTHRFGSPVLLRADRRSTPR
jgi:ubiquinone/menaquinone biosynthesis C-methylase UbiE